MFRLLSHSQKLPYISMHVPRHKTSVSKVLFGKKKTGGGFFMCSYSVLMRHFIFLKVILTRKHLSRIPFLFTFPLNPSGKIEWDVNLFYK